MKCCKISNKTRVQAIPRQKKVSLKCLHFNHWKIDTFSSGTFQLLSSLPLVRLLSSTKCNCLQIFSGQKYRESCDIFFFLKEVSPQTAYDLFSVLLWFMLFFFLFIMQTKQLRIRIAALMSLSRFFLCPDKDNLY